MSLGKKLKELPTSPHDSQEMVIKPQSAYESMILKILCEQDPEYMALKEERAMLKASGQLETARAADIEHRMDKIRESIRLEQEVREANGLEGIPQQILARLGVALDVSFLNGVKGLQQAFNILISSKARPFKDKNRD